MVGGAIVAAGASRRLLNDSSDTRHQQTAPTSSVHTPAAHPPRPSASKPTDADLRHVSALPLDDGPWRLDAVRLTRGPTGTLAGTAHIANTTEVTRSAPFGFSIVVAARGRIIGTVTGTSATVRASASVTIRLQSHYRYDHGPYRYTFSAGA